MIAARIAAETGVSPSTIFTTLRRLAKEGYVTINRRKEIHLTADGKNSGRKDRPPPLSHRTISHRFVGTRLGQSASRSASPGACDLAGSGRAAGQTAKQSNNLPARQSHPRDASGPAEKTIPLNEATDGQSVELDFITEGGERDVRLLSFLAGARDCAQARKFTWSTSRRRSA